jgi:hypothetical protein
MFQLPYSLQVVQPLKVLFGQDEFSEVPNIHLKTNSDLNLIASNVASLAVTFTPTADKRSQIDEIFESISEYFHDNRNILRVQTLEHTAKSFAATLENSYTTLNTVITPTIDAIKKDVDDRYVALMTRENAESLLPESSIESIENNYTVFDWGKITSPMTRDDILETATKNVGLKNPELTKHNLGYVTGKSDFSSEFKTLSIPKEVEDTIVEKLVSVLVDETSGITENDVKSAWDKLSNKSSYTSFCMSNRTSFSDVKNVPKNCIRLRDTAESLRVLSDAIPKILVNDLGADTFSFLSANANAVLKTTYAIQYWMLAMKELTFDNKLIMSANVLNGPVYHEFVQKGKTIVDVHNYMKAFYMGVTVPMDGIRLSSVESANSLENLERTNEKLKASASFIKSKCLINSYEHAIRKFITSGDLLVMFPHAKDPSFVAKFVKVAMIKASHLGGDPANIDKILYDLVISTFYSDTVISTLYKYMGKHFENLIDSSGDDITDDRVIEAQCASVVDLMVDYLFKHAVTA